MIVIFKKNYNAPNKNQFIKKSDYWKLQVMSMGGTKAAYCWMVLPIDCNPDYRILIIFSPTYFIGASCMIGTIPNIIFVTENTIWTFR